jgi:hypothetical protein
MELRIGQYPNYLWDMGFGLEDTIRRPLAPGLTSRNKSERDRATDSRSQSLVAVRQLPMRVNKGVGAKGRRGERASGRGDLSA